MEHEREHERTLSRRAFLTGAGGLSLAALMAACTGAPPRPAPAGPASPNLASPIPPARLRRMTGSLPNDVLQRIWRGYHPELSGRVILVPEGMNFLDGGISHSVPWPYMQRVPMLWYGPGIVQAQGSVGRPVTSAGIAPTLSALTGVPFDAPDGLPMEEVLEPGAPRPDLVVVLVWDGAGRNVLDLHPRSWPVLRSMLPQGTWFSNATVGSSPSTTAPVHATMGTGTFPRRHGVMDNFVRLPDGRLADPWGRGPAGMLAPTFGDVYGAEVGDRAIVGTVATLAWHLGMMGHGSWFEGGQRQLAVLRQSTEDTGAEGKEWGLPKAQAEHYRFVDYVRDLPPLESYFDFADSWDGTADGTWRGHQIPEIRGGFDTPARIPYQGRAVEEVVRREGFGHHEATDLLFLNFKLIDEIGHLFTASSVEMADAIRIQDRHLGNFVRFLDRQVGAGRWVLLVTADHGHTASPEVSGGFRIKIARIDEELRRRFADGEDPAAERIRPSWVFPNVDLEPDEAFLADAAAFIAGLTKEQVAADPSAVPAAERDDRVFRAAFPGFLLDGRL